MTRQAATYRSARTARQGGGAGAAAPLALLLAKVLLLAMLLVGEAWSAEPPARPALSPEARARLEGLAGVCVEEQQLVVGERAPCRGVLTPPVVLAEEELLVRHLEQVEQLYALEILRGELEREAAAAREAWLVGELEAAPRPLVERPVVAFVVGGVLGAGLAVGVAWALPSTGR